MRHPEMVGHPAGAECELAHRNGETESRALTLALSRSAGEGT
jgi:hypothetical protein